MLTSIKLIKCLLSQKYNNHQISRYNQGSEVAKIIHQYGETIPDPDIQKEPERKTSAYASYAKAKEDKEERKTPIYDPSHKYKLYPI